MAAFGTVTYGELFGAEPVAVTHPQTLDELADTVRVAAESGYAVVPNGGGLGQDYGYPLRAGSFTLIQTSGLNRIVAVEPGDLTITVEAGATLARVQAALLPHGLFLPLDPPNPERATVGGMLAVNAFGASRLGYGTARDWCIGLSVVSAVGRVTKSGGKVVKNVTGYDLPKLHIGALGTLGVIAEATFKVAPLPEATRTIIVTLTPRQNTAPGAFIATVLDNTAPTQAYRRTDATGDYVVFVFRGFVEVVEQYAQAVCAAATPLASRGASVAVFSELLDTQDAEPSAFVLRLSGDLTRDNERHERIAAGVPGTIVTYSGTGVSDLFSTQDTPAPGDGVTHRAVLHAPLAVRAALPVWTPEPASLPLMRRVKVALDPAGVFNTGRFVGRM